MPIKPIYFLILFKAQLVATNLWAYDSTETKYGRHFGIEVDFPEKPTVEETALTTIAEVDAEFGYFQHYKSFNIGSIKSRPKEISAYDSFLMGYLIRYEDYEKTKQMAEISGNPCLNVKMELDTFEYIYQYYECVVIPLKNNLIAVQVQYNNEHKDKAIDFLNSIQYIEDSDVHLDSVEGPQGQDKNKSNAESQADLVMYVLIAFGIFMAIYTKTKKGKKQNTERDDIV